MNTNNGTLKRLILLLVVSQALLAQTGCGYVAARRGRRGRRPRGR